jgi:hypothetical protein
VCLRAQAFTSAALGSVPIKWHIIIKLVTNIIQLETTLRVSVCNKANIVTVQIPLIGVILNLFNGEALYLATGQYNLLDGV